ncbi:Homeobox protein knotted-1-like 6 [Acorus gramineus]|uniref:Homeobox protein knotted-1-like 6 n=1 Tax=Acorus gramineus TaxID=55184 RepID=A0AAV9BY56_ACOGR|nr:Homeobox protein knotted-1-like 6 [Acorus gramineus]
MEEIYGLQEAVGFAGGQSEMPNAAEGLVSPTELQSMIAAAQVFRGRIPIFGSEPSFSAPVESTTTADDEMPETIKAKIASHPRYPSLLEAYIECQKKSMSNGQANVVWEL